MPKSVIYGESAKIIECLEAATNYELNADQKEIAISLLDNVEENFILSDFIKEVLLIPEIENFGLKMRELKDYSYVHETKPAEYIFNHS